MIYILLLLLGCGGEASGSAGGSSVELVDSETAYTTMNDALTTGDMEAFEEAVKASNDINYEDDGKDPILLVASETEATVQTETRAVGDPVAVRAVEILLDHRAEELNLNVTDSTNGETVLHKLAKKNRSNKS